MLISERYIIFYIFALFTTTLKTHWQQKKQRYRTCILMQQTIPNRIVIYAKDIMNITGRKERAARKLLAKIKKKYKKERGEFLSLTEFCNFTGLAESQVKEFLI